MEVLSDSINYSDSEDDDWFSKATEQSAINEEISYVDCNSMLRNSAVKFLINYFYMILYVNEEFMYF